MFSYANCYSVFLAMHYVPETTMAFASVEHIMRDVNYGICFDTCMRMERPCFSWQFTCIFLKRCFTVLRLSSSFGMSNWGCYFVIDDFDSVYGYVLP